MKNSRYTEEQVAYTLRLAESGTPVVDVCRQTGIAEATFYLWKTKYGSLGAAEVRELRQMREENARLRARRKKRLSLPCGAVPAASDRHQSWSRDFVHDQLASDMKRSIPISRASPATGTTGNAESGAASVTKAPPVIAGLPLDVRIARPSRPSC